MAVLGNSWVKKFLELGSKIYTEAQKKCDSRSWPMLPVRVCSTFVLNFGNSWRHHVQWIFELEIGSVDSSTSVRQHNMIIALGAARIRIHFLVESDHTCQVLWQLESKRNCKINGYLTAGFFSHFIWTPPRQRQLKTFIWFSSLSKDSPQSLICWQDLFFPATQATTNTWSHISTHFDFT